MIEPWMSGMIMAWLLAIVLRAAGAVARESWLPVTFLGWIFCALAAWMATAVAGAWVPLWIILGMGLAGALVELYQKHWGLRVGADALFIVLLLLLSWSPVDLTLAALAGVAFVGMGYLLDALVTWVPEKLAALGGAVSAALVVGFVVAALGLLRFGELQSDLWQEDKLHPLFLGVVVPTAGEPSELDGGGVAWVMRPPGEPRGGALFLHGADPAGAHQRAAFVVQRALVRSGYVVISLDHPGYGASPPPSPEDSVSTWDPFPAVLAAYDMLEREFSEGTQKLVVGHSMGTADVLRLLGAGLAPDLAVMMGGSMSEDVEDNDYEYHRFHSDRNIEWRLPRETWREIETTYYARQTVVQGLPPDHAPVLYVDFGIEWDNVRAQRGALWDAIPGPKRLVDLKGTTHYLNSLYVHRLFGRSLFFADTRSISRLQSLFDSNDRALRVEAE